MASSVVPTRKTRRHLVAFRDLRNWGRFKPGRNAKWNRKFPEFPNFQKKEQPREMGRNFRDEFLETLGQLFKQGLTSVEQNGVLSHFLFAERFYVNTIYCEQFHESI